MGSFGKILRLSVWTIVLTVVRCGCGYIHAADGTAISEADRNVYVHDDAGICLPETDTTLFERWDQAIRTQHFRELIEQARPVYTAADSCKDERLKADAGIYLAQAHLPLGHYDSTKIYLQAITPILRQDEAGPRNLIYHNLRAVLAIQTGLDYATALDDFFRARTIAHEIGHRSSEGLLLCNIASIYLIRKDSAGLKYARKAYNLGRQINDTLVYARALQVMSQLHEMAGNYDKALSLARTLKQLSANPGQQHNRITSLIIIGNALQGLGQQDSAAIYYTAALQLADTANDTNVRIYFDLNYGNFLLSRNAAASARTLFEHGLCLSVRNNNLRYRELLLLALAEASFRMNDTKGALLRYRQYHSFADSMARLQREHSFYRLLMRNEQLEHERAIQTKELRLVKARHQISVIVGLLVIAMLIAAGIYARYVHRNQMYRRLVEKYQQLTDLRRQTLQTAPRETSVTDDSKTKKLYEAIEELMQTRRIWRQNDLSLEAIAGLLETNKFEVSRAINRGANMTFYNYVNSYRIREAVALLSNPENNMPIKALYQHLGFNSLSVFYNSFTQETGVPPSKFRKVIRNQ